MLFLKHLQKTMSQLKTPELHIAFFDIETDFNKDMGFAPPEDPFNPVTAIAVHLNWLKTTVCLSIKPKGMGQAEAQAIIDKFPDTVLCKDEAELLSMFLDLIEDADILSGWNSEGFDIPYMVNRVARVLSKSHTQVLFVEQVSQRT